MCGSKRQSFEHFSTLSKCASIPICTVFHSLSVSFFNLHIPVYCIFLENTMFSKGVSMLEDERQKYFLNKLFALRFAEQESHKMC